MSDRELLQKAARAAGIEVIGPMGDDGLHLFNGEHWNPLTDDGDAHRLAVRLLLRVSVNRALDLKVAGSVTVEYPDKDGYYYALAEAVIDGDPLAATRRAIVRAAAAMGDGNNG